MIIVQRAAQAMRVVGSQDAKLLASRYGVDWMNKVNHIFTSHSGGDIGNALIRAAGSREKAVAAVQRVLETLRFSKSGEQTVSIVVKGVRLNARVYVRNGVATISTLEKW